MRVLFTVCPSHAHLFPMVPLAWALQSAGHEVRVASHARFADSIKAVGLTPVALGDPSADEPRMRPDARPPTRPEEVLRYADALGLDERGREHWIAYYQWLLNPVSDYGRADLPYAEDMIDFAQAWQPDLVLWDPMVACSPVAARLISAAHARFGLGLDYFGWSLDRLAERRSEVRAAGLAENPQADLIRPLAEKFGLEVDNELLYGQWTTDLMPPGMTLQTSATTLPMRSVPYSGVGIVPDWLLRRPERPRVALSLGESTRRFIKGDWGRSPKIFEAVAGLDIELVATLNSMQMEGIQQLPDNVRAVEWVPLTHLMPTCSAMIHHGGIGTFVAPSAFKVPQLVCDTGETLMMQPVEVDPNILEDGTYRIGFEFGVRENLVETVTTWELPAKKLEATPVAEYVTARGAGLALDHVKQSTEEIGDMILRVVHEPSFQAGAQAVYDSWAAMPSPTSVLPALEQLTAEHR